MQKKNLAATAAYFARRARIATCPARRLQLEAAAEFYRAKAKPIGELDEAYDKVPPATGIRASRRDKLAKLFRTYEAQRKETRSEAADEVPLQRSHTEAENLKARGDTLGKHMKPEINKVLAEELPKMRAEVAGAFGRGEARARDAVDEAKKHNVDISKPFAHGNKDSAA